MFYCPKCQCKIYPEVSLKNIQADYSINLFMEYVSLTLCSLGNFQNIEITCYRCSRCGRKFEQNDLYVKSQISNKIDKMEKFLIVSIKNKKDEKIDGKTILVIPPRVIHETELEKYKEYNPYKNDKYLIINRLTKISILTPK
jgi:hypothetical protein